MAFVLTTDAAQFRERADALLRSSLECNVMATVLIGILDGLYRDVSPLFGYELDGRDVVTAAALRTPPHPLMTSRLDPTTVAPLLAAWLEHDSGLPGANGPPQTARALAAANVDARLANHSIFVWDDGGPVSVVAIQPPVAGVVRIGPVYTPPERRRHGYAGMAVAEVSRRVLAGEADRCMLFTDLANPTSNKIYAELGYRRFADWEEYVYRTDRR